MLKNWLEDWIKLSQIKIVCSLDQLNKDVLIDTFWIYESNLFWTLAQF